MKINQHTQNIGQYINQAIKEETEFSLSIDINMVQRDIDRLKAELNNYGAKGSNKYHIANLKAIIQYLETFKTKIEDSTLEICYNVKDEIIHTYPIDFKNYKEYNINMTDYITLQNEKLIVMDMTNIIDIMAFEYIHRDFGYTHEEIEEVLESTGITSVNEPEIFSKFFEEENIKPYKLGKQAKIGESPYISMEHKAIKNYFGDKRYAYKGKSYKEVMYSNARTIMSVIASEIIKNAVSNNIEAKLVMVSETTMAFIISDCADVNIDKLVDGISIRFFGRKFKINPKTSIY